MPDNSFKYYDGTAWRIINTPKYYDGTAWRTAKEIKYYDGTTWRSVYLAVLAPTITSQPTSQTYTPSGPTITSQPTNQTSNAGTPTIGTQPTSQTSNAGTPSISGQPSASTVTAGATASFSVTASSPDSGSISYQWQRSTDSGVNFSNVTTGSGGTTASYTTETTTTGMSNYRYRCVITNTKSNSNTFSISATSPDSGTISYLWYLNGSSTGITTTSYTTSTAGTVYCAVTNTKANNNTFSITATAGGTLSYQWKLNGSNVGTNSSTYTTNSAGSVQCVVTNSQSGSVTFNISSTGNGTVVNLWYFNGAYTGSSGNSYTTSVASSNIYCVAQNTRNGVSLTTQSNTVASTVSGTASTNSSSVTSTVNTTTNLNSTSVTSTVNTTATATSSSATLTVNSSITNVRPSGFPVGANSIWVNSGNTVDGSLGDTTTYGNPNRFGNFPAGDWVGNADLTWASQATTSSTLYLQFGYESQDLLASGVGAGIYYSTNGGSSYTQIASYSADGGSATATAASVGLPASVNLSNVRVRAEVHSYKDGFDVDFVKIRVYDAYIQYQQENQMEYTPQIIETENGQQTLPISIVWLDVDGVYTRVDFPYAEEGFCFYAQDINNEVKYAEFQKALAILIEGV